MKNIGDYHGLYVLSDTLLLYDVLKNFLNTHFLFVDVCKNDKS